MSANVEFSKEGLDNCFKELGKEFRKRNGTKMPADIILIGGASVLINYGFRDVTTDADAVIRASSVMKEAIFHVADKLNLPHDWLNQDFKNTDSYSEKLFKVAKRYRTFSNILHLWTVAGEYLVAMKLISLRQYKYDLSDVAGILWEHEKAGNPISRESIDKAIETLYEGHSLSEAAIEFIDDAFKSGDYEQYYNNCRELEKQGKEILVNFREEYPDVKGVKANDIIEQARKKSKN